MLFNLVAEDKAGSCCGASRQTWRRWSKRRPALALAMSTIWLSMAPPAMPHPQATRGRRAAGYSLDMKR
jgi:hypothetical protein